MLTEMCLDLRNWFDDNQPKWFDDVTIANGELVGFSDRLQDGQYFRIVGSVFNDGVYQFPATELHDETFKNGAVWAMAVPPDFLDIMSEQQKFNAKVEELALVDKGYASESFGGYSYSLSSAAPAYMTEWLNRINRRLNKYRKIA
jgi:hypothetical protein